MHVSWRAIADHAVESVDRLVRRHPGQSEQHAPEQRRDDAVGEVLRRGFDGGAGYAMRIQTRRVAANDAPHRLPAPFETVLQSGRDRGDVIMEAARRNQRAHGEAEQQPAERQAYAQFLHRESEQHARADHQQTGISPTPRLHHSRRRQIKPAFLQPRNGAAHQHHRMGHAAPKPAGVAQAGVQRQGQQEASEEQSGVHQQHAAEPSAFASGAARRGLLSKAAPAIGKGHR